MIPLLWLALFKSLRAELEDAVKLRYRLSLLLQGLKTFVKTHPSQYPQPAPSPDTQQEFISCTLCCLFIV